MYSELLIVFITLSAAQLVINQIHLKMRVVVFFTFQFYFPVFVTCERKARPCPWY